MSNLTIFFTVLTAVFVIGGWITSEYISSRNAKKNKQFAIAVAKLERENRNLISDLTTQTTKYTALKEEFEKIREAKAQIRTLENDYKKLRKVYERTADGIQSLRTKCASKKYSSNSLSKDVLIHLDENCPSQEQLLAMRHQSSQDVFKRIKQNMGMEKDGP